MNNNSYIGPDELIYNNDAQRLNQHGPQAGDIHTAEARLYRSLLQLSMLHAVLRVQAILHDAEALNACFKTADDAGCDALF